ncbi:MAG: glycoside hydrolase family 2, partial [Phycisphaerae bacterium]|nr:glycoside hydrolase family 2 [Phycisphaerae bacterium]
VMWVPFNEGWGQFDTKRITAWVKEYDPSRLVNCASGWNDVGVGDVHDIHSYPGPASPKPEEKRAAVLGEFGGLGLPLAGHTWQAEKNWGYRSYEDSAALTDAYVTLLERLRLLIVDPGLSAAVYTQTTDVEIEVNGMLTYDRAKIKMDSERVAKVNRELYGPLPKIVHLAPSAMEESVTWRYTFETPADDWVGTGFDDTAWKSGTGGFGTEQTPGIVLGTKWDTSDIWMRRSIELTAAPQHPYLKLFHDEDCEVYINGQQVAALKDYTTSYVMVLIEAKYLHAGENTLAVHCHNKSGGQGADVGLVDLVEGKAE